MQQRQPVKAFGYLRVSGSSQLEGDGFPRQRLAIERYARANGLEIVRWFEEQAVRGSTDFTERPAWMQMISSLNGTRTIVVEALHRLARDMGVQEYIFKDLTRLGIALHSTHEEDVQNPEPARVLFRQMMGAISQYERSMIVLKLRGARERMKAKTGKCEGPKFYGHKDDRPEEARTLTRMIDLRARGESFSQIARVLNADGSETRHGRAWAVTTVRTILAREVMNA